jgi:hypothetical protein
MESVYEQFFYLKHMGGWSFSEAYNLPVGLRKWFVERLSKYIQEQNEAMQAAQNGSGNPHGKTQTLTEFNSPAPPPNWGGKKTG